MLAHSRRGLLRPKALRILLLEFVSVAVMCAQTPNSTPSTNLPSASPETGTKIKVRVNLVQVRVVVRDSKGNPVRGLTREDFRFPITGSSKSSVTFPLRPVSRASNAPKPQQERKSILLSSPNSQAPFSPIVSY